MNSWIAPDLFKPQAVTAWPFQGLEPQAYDFIMIDPPWHFELRSDAGEEKSPQAQYPTMSLEAIAALPVADLARETCLLWLWCTAPGLRTQLPMLDAWGFTFVTSGVWLKTTAKGKHAFGTGYFLRSAHEPFVLASRGEPPMPRPRNVRSVVPGLVREHSRKPDSAYAAAERLTSGFAGPVRRADLFSRETRPGWESWGNEAGKFDGAGAERAPEAPGKRGQQAAGSGQPEAPGKRGQPERGCRDDQPAAGCLLPVA